ncbi:MAG: FtsX-like permease family protein [Kiritimatiellia bacterium]
MTRQTKMNRGAGLTLVRLALRVALYHWRTYGAVLLGTAIASAVLVGALLVGDSTRFTLRAIALERLGKVRFALDVGRRFLTEHLAREIGKELPGILAPVLRLNGVAIRTLDGNLSPVTVNRVQVLGVDDSFWRLAPQPIRLQLRPGEVALSSNLASALGVRVGDEISLRIELPALLTRDAPLSSRADRLAQRTRFRVACIVPDVAMGRFDLRANQLSPFNVFVPLAYLQQLVNLRGKVNLFLLGGRETPTSAARVQGVLRQVWNPGYCGYRVRQATAADICQLETERIFFDSAVTGAVLQPEPGAASGENEPVGALAYLVNSIEKHEGAAILRTPYSFLVGLTPTADRRLGVVPAQMRDNEILINRWLAEQLAARPGDVLKLKYFKITPTGALIEQERSFTVYGIVEMEELAVERELMPAFPGLSDADSCRNWNIGMPINEEDLRHPQNEAYWKQYRTTPKAFITLRAGQEMWASHLGDLTAVRYAGVSAKQSTLLAQLGVSIDPAELGLVFVPVREQALKAAAAATDLGQLFLGMSIFLIAGALILVGLLFSLGLTQRLDEVGLLRALGFQKHRVATLFLLESVAIAAAGSIAGILLGVAYTWALLYALNTVWGGAVAGTTILFHAQPTSLIAGGCVSFVVALLVLSFALFRNCGVDKSLRDLLDLPLGAEAVSTSEGRVGSRSAIPLVLCSGGAVAAAIVVWFGVTGAAENSAATFFAAGALLLVTGICGLRIWLRSMAQPSPAAPVSLNGLAVRNAARRPGRSLAVAGLLASGLFMLVAVTAMQHDITRDADKRWSGTGGYKLVAEATLSVPDAPESAEGRKRFGLDGEPLLEQVPMISLKVHGGDDATCFNLNRPLAPRLIGVEPDRFAVERAFLPPQAKENLWKLLEVEMPPGIVPGLVGDSDTATWSLKLKAHPVGGDVISYRDERGCTFQVKLVGRLPMRISIFQGAILIPLAAFVERFPSEEGYRLFLIDAPRHEVPAVRDLLLRKLDMFGLDLTPAVERLKQFYSAEVTYLRMFLVLGGLGLLLGSAGMAVVVLRNVVERRSELALLRCLGLTRHEIARMVAAEHWTLLAVGLVLGVLAALVAIWPVFRTQGAQLPVRALLSYFLGVIALGAGWIVVATYFAMRGPLLPALRHE